MRKVVIAFLAVTALAANMALAQMAADKAGVDKAAAAAAPKLVRPLPFKVGETLTYEISFSKFIFSGTIGELKLLVEKGGGSKPELLETRAVMESKGFFPKLFGMKVNNHFSALVSSEDFGLHTATRLIEEGNVRREQKTVVDREKGRVIYTDRDLVNGKADPKIKESNSPNWVHDTISALYYLRTQKLKEGDRLTLPVTDAGQVHDIPVVVGKSEEIKVDAGKFKTVQLDTKIFGLLVRRDGEMVIWVTDDERHIPVRARIKTSAGTVTVSLKSIS
jgi:hypothetical protein